LNRDERGQWVQVAQGDGDLLETGLCGRHFRVVDVAIIESHEVLYVTGSIRMITVIGWIRCILSSLLYTFWFYIW